MRDRARDWGRGHQKQVRFPGGFGEELCSLLHTEAMLFVNDDQAEGGELRPLGEECVGADHQCGAPLCGRSPRRAPLSGGGAAQHECDLNAERGEESLGRCSVLARQQLSRRKEGALMPSGGRCGSSDERHRSLTRAHIALE